MKFNIKTNVEFASKEDIDLLVWLQIDHDTYLTEPLSFDELLRRSLRGLTPADKRDKRRKIYKSLKAFLEKLEW